MTILQILVAYVLGIAAGFGANAVLPADSAAYLPAVIGGAVGLLTLLGQMLLARLTAGRDRGVARIVPTQRQLRERAGTRSFPTTGTTGGGTKRTDVPPPAPKVRSTNGRLEVTVEGTTITVTATGYTGREWKERVRPALERVRVVKWQHPKNLHDGRRQMQGTLTGNAEQAKAAIANIG
jgi:hypothetical protein